MERSILFSTPMVQAIYAGHKTMTRRIIKDKTALSWLDPDCGFDPAFVALRENHLCKFGFIGDRLWVRETFAFHGRPDISGVKYIYKADKSTSISTIIPWKPSIHMPREASRITLEIINIRVERLHDISEEDAKAEGVEKTEFGYKNYDNSYPVSDFIGGETDALRSFQSLWRTIYGKESWENNPWVWVIEFKQINN